MILNKTVKMRWSSSNRERLESLGYKFTKIKDEVEIKLEHLSNYSKVLVDVQCDYCGKKYSMIWDRYFKNVLQNKFIKKVACKSCSHLKYKEVLNKQYGVDNISQVETFQKKKIQTFLKKYGVDNPSKADEIKKKKAETTFKNYGVYNPFAHEDIKKQIFLKKAETMYLNNSQVCSKQQKYIAKTLGGEINYNVGALNLDMAFIDENVYLEYDGSGHKLCIILNRLSEEEFQIKEQKRYCYLKNKGWKMIRIVSIKDFLPTPKVLKEMLEFSRVILKNNSWVIFDVDNEKIKSNIINSEYDFGKLKQLPKKRKKK